MEQCQRLEVTVDGMEFMDIDIDKKLAIVFDIFRVKSLNYCIMKRKVEPPTQPPAKNAFTTLMAKTRTLKQMEERNKKDKLANDLISDIQSDGHQLLAGSLSHSDGHPTLSNLTNAVWYLDGRSSIIQEASKHNYVKAIPER